MDFMTWSPALETGIEALDRQHRGLLDLVNAAAPLLSHAGGADPAEVLPLLAGLADYAGTHFQTEEDLMAEAGLDTRFTDRHQGSHARFADWVSARVAEANQGGAVHGEELLAFLAGWLLYHILGEDQALARQLRARAVGMDAQTAYQEAAGAETAPDPQDLTRAIVALYRVNAQSQQAQAAQGEVLATIAQLQALFIAHGEEQVIFEAALDALLRLTQSEYGFIAEVRTDPDRRRYQQCLAISNIGWDGETRRLYDEQAPQGFRFYACDGLYEAAIGEGRPVIANDAAADPRSHHRLPAGLPPLRSFLGLPLRLGETIMGSIGLANRLGGYDQALAEGLRPVTDTCAQLIAAIDYRHREQDSEQALRASETRYRALVEQSRVVHWEYDLAADRFTYVSPNAGDLLGYPPSAWTDLASWAAMIHPEDRAAAVARCSEETGVGRRHATDYRVLTTDGRTIPVRDLVTVGTAPDGRPTRLSGVIADTTQAHETLSRIEHLTHHDPLTGLANNLLLSSRVHQAMAEVDDGARPLALLVLNLDRFAQLNETLGRSAGDRVLCILAERWGAALGPRSTLARLGADGYAALIEDLPNTEAVMEAGTRLREALQQPIAVGDQSVSLTMSIGIALYPGEARDPEDLLHQAEDAMREAKADKGNQVHFYDRRHAQATADWFRTETALRRAVDEGQLCLTFQPQVDLASGRLVGAEALLRWHREGEIVLPGQFIHVVEGTDLAEPISRWVLATACAQARVWLDRSHPLRVAVNIFSGHVTGGRLVEDVRQALVATSLPPHMLELELVELSLLAQPERSAQTLRALKRLGVRLALDDFGTGYSSLGYLKHYPFDLLKIDRLFTSNVSRDPQDAAIVRSTVELAHNLGIEVLAEGVETPGQWRFLARYGCDQAQGFLLSRPVPPEDVETLVMERRDLRPPDTCGELAQGILLVEDDAVEAEFLKALFEDGGARTYWARDTAEALALVESRAIDLIVTDYYLGETTGTQVLFTLHGLYPEIPAIMVSGSDEQEVVIDALNRGGIRAFLPKPLDPDRLTATLDAILGRAGTRRQG